MIREALYYDRVGVVGEMGESDESLVQCHLCPANCRLKPDQRGLCHSRFNDNGRLVTDNFGQTVTIALDPIEKKPLYHFLPTRNIISIGANGCNLSCRHCQNWQISQKTVPTKYISPEDLPKIASRDGSIGVAYTYTEPMIWYEYIMEAAPSVRQAGLVNVMVSNGYINLEPLDQLLPLIDAFNIDLKGMNPEFYRKICGGRLEPVLDVIRRIACSDAHLELTNLIIPGVNDSDDDINHLVEFVAGLNKNIPLHFSAYHPNYKANYPTTSKEILMKAYRMARQRLNYVFVGNMEIESCSNSYCAGCQTILIERTGYSVSVVGLDRAGNCTACGTEAHICQGDEN